MYMENKKIKNASPTTVNGIKFKSLSEAMTYKTLLAEGFSPEYEKTKYTIWTGFEPTIEFHTKNAFKGKNKRIVPVSLRDVLDARPIRDITYTPDFEFTYKGVLVIVEVKGMQNDVFPYKFKMFRKWLESNYTSSNCELWEIFTKGQLLDCIKNLRNKYGEVEVETKIQVTE